MGEMQLKVLEILHPEIQKLKNFMAFQAGFCYSLAATTISCTKRKA